MQIKFCLAVFFFRKKTVSNLFKSGTNFFMKTNLTIKRNFFTDKATVNERD